MGLWDRLFGREDAKAKNAASGHASSHAGAPGVDRDYDRGIQLYDAGKYDEAIIAFNTVLSSRRIGPLVERLARFYLAESHSAAALGQLRRGDLPAEAIDNLRTAISLNPGFADLHFRLGSTYLKADRPDEAIVPLRHAIEINPRYVQALLHLAVAILQSSTADIAEVARIVTKLNDLGYTAGKAALETARIALANGDRAAAARAIAPLTESPENDEALLLAADALEMFRRGDYALAEAAYRAALAQKPRYADLRNQLGVTLFAQDIDEQALSEFDAAIAINPRYAEAHLNRGFVLFRLGRTDDAMEAIRRAMELDPDNAVAMVRMKKMFPQL